MGLFNATAFLKGAAQEGLNMFNKAETIGEEGLENLKAARAEVNEEIKEVKGKYDKAIQVADNVGGGAFAKYLINTRGYDYLADLSTATEESLQEELGSLKTKFNALDEKDKAKLSDGDFSEFVKSDYDKEVESLKVNGGLVNTNNLGVATANTLGGKVQAMVDRQFEPRRQDIIDTVGGGTLRESKPTAGGFDAVPSGMQGEIDYLNAGAYGMEYQELKNTAESAFEKYLESNRFKVDGTNMYLTSQKFDEVASIVFPRLSSQEAKEEISSIATILGYSDEQVVEDILKQKFLDRSYGGTFKYTGVLSMIDQLNEAADASVE